jgi:cytoskeletal protein RodZ
MSDHERGAYAPPTDAPLSFDPRQPVRGSRPLPFTLIISILVLLGVAAGIFVFYRSGVRQAGQPPQAVGAPVSAMKAPPPAEAQPQDPAAGLQIYKTEGGKTASGPGAPRFTPGPEQPQARPEPAAPKVVVTQAPLAAPAPAAATPAPALRPSIQAQPPAATTPAPPPAPKVEKAAALPAAKPARAKPEAKAEAKAAKAPPEPAAKATGANYVQIGAVSSQTLADKAWSDAAAIAPAAAAGKGKNVEKVDVNGKTLYRVQVTGFGDRVSATAFCDKLKAAGKACFVK